MDEVSGPVVAIGLVLCAVFVPVSFMGGIVGQLYRQFAITISISVILSVIVALTLTPALCSMMLRPRKEIRGPVGALPARLQQGVQQDHQRLSRRRGLLPAAGGDRPRLPRRPLVRSGQPADEAADRLRSERRPGLLLHRLQPSRRRFDGAHRPVDEARRSGSEEHSRRGGSPHHGRPEPSDQRLHLEQRFHHHHAQAVGREEEQGRAAQGRS